MIGLITPGMKQTGKRSAGKPHAAFDVAGAGDVTMVAGLRYLAKAMELPPAPTVRAPAPDPTCERLGAKFPGPTRRRVGDHSPYADLFLTIYAPAFTLRKMIASVYRASDSI